VSIFIAEMVLLKDRNSYWFSWKTGCLLREETTSTWNHTVEMAGLW